MTTRAQVVSEARRWVGTRWRHQGYDRVSGCDCFGLIAGVAHSLSLPGMKRWYVTPEYHNYAPQPDPRLLIRCCDELFDRVGDAAARLADVLVLRFASEPVHFALLSCEVPRRVIHALARPGRVVENGFSEAPGNLLYRVYRFRGLED